MTFIGIDPGTTHSGIVKYKKGCRPFDFGKLKNNQVLDKLRCDSMCISSVAIEEINPYTMGKTTRDTLIWSGRFQEALENRLIKVKYIQRNTVRMHLCGSAGSKIKDAHIVQALVDRFAYGEKNFGKGTKKEPGFFYGFKADIWQAFALVVCLADMEVTT